MLKKSHFLRLVVLILCIAALSAGMVAQAAEPIPSVRFVKVTENGQCVDSLNGVEARYNLLGYKTLWCAEYVSRYYETLYGTRVYVTNDGPIAQDTTEYWFEKISDDELPRTGDLLFGPWYLRGRDYNHWAIVKSYDQYTGLITIIEQNFRNGNNAAVDRTLDYPSDYYYVYRLVGADGEAVPALPAEHQLTSDAARQAVDTASKLGIATVADGFQTGIRADNFLTMCCNTIRAVKGYTTFADPKDPIDAADRLGLISKDVWSDDQTVTRERAAVILVRLAKLLASQPETDSYVLNIYEDAAAISAGCRDYVAAATALGLLGGEDTFDPLSPLTWQQALVSLTDLAQNEKREIVLTLAIPSAAEAAASLVSDLLRK